MHMFHQRVSIPRFFSNIWSRSISTSNRPQDSIEKSTSKRCKPGQNLTKRYQPTTPIRTEVQSLAATSSCSLLNRTVAAKDPEPQTFYGQKVPLEPALPPDDLCCMSGCGKCVYDLYEEKLGTFKEAVAAIRNALESMKVPESEWPTHIRSESMQMYRGTEGRQTAVMSAFEEMERALARKKQTNFEIA